MDGKGRECDNLFLERLWRSVKYEEVYLKPTSPSKRPEAALQNISRSTIMNSGISLSANGRPERSIRPGHLPKRPDDSACG